MALAEVALSRKYPVAKPEVESPSLPPPLVAAYNVIDTKNIQYGSKKGERVAVFDLTKKDVDGNYVVVQKPYQFHGREEKAYMKINIDERTRAGEHVYGVAVSVPMVVEKNVLLYKGTLHHIRVSR